MRGKYGVSTSFGLVEDEEEGRSGRLPLVRDIGVPGRVIDAVVSEVVFEKVVLSVTVDDVELREPFDIAGGWMTLDRTEVTRESVERA